MSKGIVVFGANGSGKTTVGRELARTLHFKHMDVEDYYFEEAEIPYSRPCSKDEVIGRMLDDIEKCSSFVLSAVTGDFGEAITSMYEFAIFLSVPLDTRIERVKRRAEEQYGKRVWVGGDMYEQECKFAEFVETRNLSVIDDWAKTLTCPVVRLDGTKAISENIRLIVEQYKFFASDK